jgi:hypothetical protein
MGENSYLNARNLIYENDFQSKKSVLNVDSDVMCNTVKDYQYFEDWLKEIKHHNPAFVATSSNLGLAANLCFWCAGSGQ